MCDTLYIGSTQPKLGINDSTQASGRLFRFVGDIVRLSRMALKFVTGFDVLRSEQLARMQAASSSSDLWCPVARGFAVRRTSF